MAYAIYCKNFIRPRWNKFRKPHFKPTAWSRFCRVLGFSKNYDAQVAEIARLESLDPAQDDINAWAKRWNVDPEVFRSHPREVYLESTDRQVSETFENRDICALVLDTRFNTDTPDSHFIYSVNCNDTCWEFPVAVIYNHFYIKEIPEGGDEQASVH